MTQEKTKQVLISGAGIAGLTAAYWLVRQGWKVVVLEKADALRKGEFVIDFAGTGWDVAGTWVGSSRRYWKELTTMHLFTWTPRHRLKCQHGTLEELC